MSTIEPTLKSEEDADLESYENVEDDAIPMGNSIEKSLSSSLSIRFIVKITNNNAGNLFNFVRKVPI